MSKPKTEYGYGLLTDNNGQIPPYEYSVREKDKGFFVIINNYLYKYWHHIERGLNPIKLDSMETVYIHDLKVLCKTFNITQDNSNVA